MFRFVRPCVLATFLPVSAVSLSAFAQNTPIDSAQIEQHTLASFTGSVVDPGDA
jgi:hypothetical protein